MYISKNFVGAVATAIIWMGAIFLLYLRRDSDLALLMSGVVLFFAFAVSYFVLQSLDKTYTHNSRSRVDRFLTTLDDNELDALSNRLNDRQMRGSDYGSPDDLLMEDEIKSKRR